MFIAICACSIGLHIGIDNATVVHRTNAIEEGTLSKKKSRALLPDADLWQQAEDCICIRGPKSTVCSWHKSHASWEQHASVAVNPALAIHNGIADLAANHGLEAQEWNDIQSAMDFLARKQDAYAKFICRVQRMMCDPSGELPARQPFRVSTASSSSFQSRHTELGHP